MTTIPVKRSLAISFRHSAIALALVSLCALPATAQNGHSHAPATEKSAMSRDHLGNVTALVKVVRDSTERFKDVKVARRKATSCNSAV